MKIAVCVATGAVDAYGYLHRYAELFAAAARARGLDVEILRHPGSDFYPRLLANLADENCIVHFYGYLFDLKKLGDGDARMLDLSRATTVVSIGDHPFSTFMHSTVYNAHPRSRFIVMEETFQDEMEALNPAVAGAHYDHQPIPPPVNYDKHRAVDFKDRAYDLVVPMFLADMRGHNMAFVRSQLTADWFEKAVVQTYECMQSGVEKNPFHILHDCIQANVGLTFAQMRDHNPPLFNQILITMAAIDGIVRQERRQKMLGTLLRSTGGLRVAVTGNPLPSLEVAENVEFVGVCSVTEVASLMANSRAVMNCNPSYPSSLHERVVSGMMYESCVITDVNSYIAKSFSADEYVAYAPESEMSIADIYAAHDIEAVARTGARKVHGDPSYSWNGHINRLMHAALC